MGAPGLRPLAGVVDQILANADEEAHFVLRAEELMAAMGMAAEDYYRVGYELRSTLHFGDLISGFSDETVGDLVTFLENHYGTAAETALESIGVFLRHETRAELRERFLHSFVAALSAHRLDEEVFRAMLRAEGNYRSAKQLYLGEFFPNESFVNATAAAFISEFALPQRAIYVAERFLRLLLQRHAVDPEEILQPVVRRLHYVAVTGGYARYGTERAHRRRSGSGAETGDSEPNELLEAMRVLGIGPEEISKERVRERYRVLIRKFHPDVNPAGLEMSKRLNSSYAILMATLAS